MISIRNSSDADLHAVLTWLKDEYDQLHTGQGFWCNCGVIERAHGDGDLLIGVEDGSREVVAFQVGSLLTPGIMEVRPDRRGKGYGRRVVEYCVDEAYKDDECVLHIECNPDSSVPFWIANGFQLFSNVYGSRCPCEYGNHAFRVLEISHGDDSSLAGWITVHIRFRSECGFMLNEAHFEVEHQKDGRLLLPRRVVSYCPSLVFASSDTLIEISIDGRMLYSDKAKYPEAEKLGVECRSGDIFFIDALEFSGVNAVGGLL